ncbi:PAS domain-containing sensor histidine kinase [Denitratisoma sp. agr-D3]
METKKTETDSLLPTTPAHCQPDAGLLGDNVFLHAVEQADIAISITDAHANILYVNPSFSRVTGYAPSEAVGCNESMLSNKTTPPEVYKALWRNISRGKAWTGRLINRRKNGSRYLAELTITPVTDDQGLIVNYLGLHRDLTDVHRLECKVRNQMALISSVVDGAPMVLALLNENNKVVLDNQEYKKLLTDLDMAEPAHLLLDALGSAYNRDPATAKDGYAFLDQEVRIDRKGNGTPRWFSCSGVWVKVDDDHADAFFTAKANVYLLLVAKETTSLRAQQEKARMAALQALVAEEERVNALRESLSAAVYQLEGPLNMISSAVGMMARRNQDEPMTQALAEALKNGEEALEKLRGMIPRQSSTASATANINELLHSVLDLSTPRLLAAGISVAWKPQATLPPINGYPNSLITLFKSLVDNAIDAMSTRGWRERELTLVTRTVGNDIEILVQDSGPGIPADLQLKVFEPFFTTKPQGRHMGTGLAIAQQIVVDHGGTIAIESGPPQGCTMHILLPVSR